MLPQELDIVLEHIDKAVLKGQWAAFDRILNWLNTEERVLWHKSQIYDAIMKMRPE